MKFIPTEIPDVIIVEPDVFGDDRGFFFESFHAKKYAEIGITHPLVQDNHARSAKDVLRGLHAQRKSPQGKLIRVIEGEIFDVAADIRVGSPTYLRWVGVTLSAKNYKQLWVPPGFLHGYCVLSETTQVEYKCTDFYDPGDEYGVIWDDPELAIAWPIDTPVLSKKDLALPKLSEISEEKRPVFQAN